MLPLLMLYGIIIVVLVLFSLGFGIRLTRQSRDQFTPERRQTLRWAGGNLIEPAINIIVVYGLMTIFLPDYVNLLNDHSPTWDLIPRVMLVTLPILILLKPLLGWNSADPPSRNLNRAMVGLGLLRWGGTILGLIFAPAVLLGIIIHFCSLMIITGMAASVINPTPQHVYGIAVGLGPEGVRVAPVGDFSHDDHPGITF
jgi:hypothetical protein